MIAISRHKSRVRKKDHEGHVNVSMSQRKSLGWACSWLSLHLDCRPLHEASYILMVLLSKNCDWSPLCLWRIGNTDFIKEARELYKVQTTQAELSVQTVNVWHKIFQGGFRIQDLTSSNSKSTTGIWCLCACYLPFTEEQNYSTESHRNRRII